MLTEMDTAILLIKAAATADGRCSHCASGVLGYAMILAPDLPWRLAAQGLAAADDDFAFALDVTDGR